MKKIKTIFMLLAAAINRRVIAVLDMPDDIDDFISFANGIHGSMTESTYFGALTAKLATLLANIGLLQVAHNATKNVPPTGTVTARNIELNKVQNNLRGLQADVQELADAASPEVAEDIITTAGMKVKRAGTINKQDLEIKDGPVSGTVKAVAKAPDEPRAAHDWGYSNDEGATWVHATPTIQATTIIEGLTRGEEIIVRHRNILPDGPEDYTISEPFLVR